LARREHNCPERLACRRARVLRRRKGRKFFCEVNCRDTVLQRHRPQTTVLRQRNFQPAVLLRAFRQFQHCRGQVSRGKHRPRNRHHQPPVRRREIQLHPRRICQVRRRFHAFQIHAVRLEHAGYVCPVRQLRALLTVKEERYLLHRVKSAQRRRRPLHHQQLFLRVLAAQRLLAQVHARLAARNVQIERHALWNNVPQPHPRRREVIFRRLHHQAQRRLRHAVLQRNLARDRHEIPLAVLIPADGSGHFDIRRCVRDGLGADIGGEVSLLHGGLGLLSAADGEDNYKRRRRDNEQPFHGDAAGEMKGFEGWKFRKFGKFHVCPPPCPLIRLMDGMRAGGGKEGRGEKKKRVQGALHPPLHPSLCNFPFSPISRYIPSRPCTSAALPECGRGRRPAGCFRGRQSAYAAAQHRCCSAYARSICGRRRP
jgi:hypothetical protein